MQRTTKRANSIAITNRRRATLLAHDGAGA
jgi:hypothetical protein